MLNVEVSSKIYRPVSEVFQAVINPDKLSKYFISRYKGEMKEGETMVWYFDDYGVELNADITVIQEGSLLAFSWEASGYKKDVSIKISPLDDQTTEIQIIEQPFENHIDDIKRVIQQTQGWTDFICCLKAYLYTGINLRNPNL